jgi:hypothetical protein
MNAIVPFLIPKMGVLVKRGTFALCARLRSKRGTFALCARLRSKRGTFALCARLRSKRGKSFFRLLLSVLPVFNTKQKTAAGGKYYRLLFSFPAAVL